MFAAGPAYIREFGELWRAADKIVYSTTLVDVHTGRTRIERSFDPDAVRRLKEAAENDLSIGGPHLAGQALRAGLVDELGLLAVPAVVGGGTPWLPRGRPAAAGPARGAPLRRWHRLPALRRPIVRAGQSTAGGGASVPPRLRRRNTCRTTLSSSSLSSLARPRYTAPPATTAATTAASRPQKPRSATPSSAHHTP